MSNIKNLSALSSITILAILLSTLHTFGQDSLNIKVSNIKKNTGKIIVEIYNSKTTWLKTPFKIIELSSNQDVKTAAFKVPYGRYAITIYQDLNENGKADMNFLGIPKELVGFGNNYKPFGEPKFESCLIDYKPKSTLHEIKLYKVL